MVRAGTPFSKQRVYLYRIQPLNTPPPAKYRSAGMMTAGGFISSDSTLKIELLYQFAMKSKALYSQVQAPDRANLIGGLLSITSVPINGLRDKAEED